MLILLTNNAFSGMDARAYRLGCLKECTVFELDFPELLEMKSDLLHEAMSSPNHQKLTMMAKSLVRVPANIQDEEWITNMQSCGYVPERNTIWVLEGIIYYLHNAPAMHVLETVAASCTSASTVLLADFMNKNATSLSPTIYHFCHESPELLLHSIGFSQVTLSQIGDPQAHFGLLSHPDNLFEKLRRLPRSMDKNPEDGTPCCRLYFVEASASPDNQTR
jgi:methyltransferase (TIGR00027 family)